jgi:plastocyanin
MKVVYSVAFGVAAFFALNCGSGDEGGGYSAPSGVSTPAQTAAPTDPNVVEVKVEGHVFDPPEVHIKANQTVRWVWISGVHNVISGVACLPDGKFGSGNTASGTTYEHKFETRGSFPYFCDPHCSIGMKGTVIVE